MPAPVALLVASRYALPGYGDRRVWFRVALLPTRTLSCTYVLDCNRGNNEPSDDDDDDDDGFEARAGRITVSGYSGLCFEIKFSGRHRGFDDVLFNL